MLTVKRIDGRYEDVQEAKTVSYYAAKGGKGGFPAQLFVEDPDGDIREVHSSGTYYIMNESGQTIARYYMRPSREPSGPSEMPADLATS